MGEVSTYLVPRGSFVQVPVASGHLNCQRVCRCGHHNVLEHCVNIEPCTRRDSCLQGRGQVIRGEISTLYRKFSVIWDTF